jgi:hypothetical protein
MTDRAFPSKKNTSTAPTARLRRRQWTADCRTAMKPSRPTSPSLRTCLRARSQALPYASDLAARMYEAANTGAGALRHVPRGPAEGARLSLVSVDFCGRCADPGKTRIQILNPSPGAMYSGISNAMVTISRVEGITTLWRGLSSVVMGAGWSTRLRPAAAWH